MKTSGTILMMCLMSFLIPSKSVGQNVGNWTFNNLLTGTGTANNTVSAAALGSSITSGDYNGGTVYFGEDGWPSGAMDLHAYLQFSLSPNSGRFLSLTYLTMQIRRSTTGTPSGSGPTKWSLRSSLDGYAADIASGTLTTNSTPATTVSLPVAFLNVSTTITFRLYGYNAVVTSGGLNRFVYDNISVAGTVILPVLIEDFHAARFHTDAAKLSWTVNADEASSVSIEKSYDAADFFTIKNMTVEHNVSQQYEFVDAAGGDGHATAYYRIKMISDAGSISYSNVETIHFDAISKFTVNAMLLHSGAPVQVQVNTQQPDEFHFCLYDFHGAPVAAKTMSLGQGAQWVTVTNQPLRAGLYVMITEQAGKKLTTQIMIQ